jgi:hypothetical protein
VTTRHPAPEAVLCALVLAPEVLSRNRFYDLFQHEELRRVRKRAARLRGVLRQLTAAEPREAEVLGEQTLENGRWLLCYRMAHLDCERTVALEPLEASLVRFALGRSGRGTPEPEDRSRVLTALSGLGAELDFAGSWGAQTLPPGASNKDRDLS